MAYKQKLNPRTGKFDMVSNGGGGEGGIQEVKSTDKTVSVTPTADGVNLSVNHIIERAITPLADDKKIPTSKAVLDFVETEKGKLKVLRVSNAKTNPKRFIEINPVDGTAYYKLTAMVMGASGNPDYFGLLEVSFGYGRPGSNPNFCYAHWVAFTEGNPSAQQYKTVPEIKILVSEDKQKMIVGAVCPADTYQTLELHVISEDVAYGVATYGTNSTGDVIPSDFLSGATEVEIEDMSLQADEEDLTASVGKLQLKDREATTGNMGYVILRKDKTFKEQVEGKPNTIFEIRYEFEVGGTEADPVVIPENCVLKFEGGCVVDGHIDLKKSRISGVNGIRCRVKSTLPVKSSVLGLGVDWEADSAQRLSDLINDEVPLVIDSDINCDSAVVSNCKRFRLVGEYDFAFRRPLYTITFNNTEGFVLQGSGSATGGLTFGHVIRNLNIKAKGTCINMWGNPPAGTFAENTFENLYLESLEADCIDYGENYGHYATAGFNQYFRQIQAKALNGACFRNVHANVLMWDHITIYGSKDGGWYNCTGFYENCIFDQGNNEIGWVFDKNDSVATVVFRKCHFESLKHPILASVNFNGGIWIEEMYANIPSRFDDPDDGKKHFCHFDFGNAREICIIGLRNNLEGGAFATGFERFKTFKEFKNLGETITAINNNGYVKTYFGIEKTFEHADYNQTEYGKELISPRGNARFEKLETKFSAKIPVKTSELSFSTYNSISTNGTLGKTIIIDTDITQISGWAGYQIPYRDSIGKIFEFDIINRTTNGVVLKHRLAASYYGTPFNCFTGSDVTIPPKGFAHCRVDGSQTKGEIVSGKYVVDVVYCSNYLGVATKGTSEQRPQLTSDDISFEYFDTTLNRPIWWNGTAWVDMNPTVTPTLTTGTEIADINGTKIYAPIPAANVLFPQNGYIPVAGLNSGSVLRVHFATETYPDLCLSYFSKNFAPNLLKVGATIELDVTTDVTISGRNLQICTLGSIASHIEQLYALPDLVPNKLYRITVTVTAVTEYEVSAFSVAIQTIE